MSAGSLVELESSYLDALTAKVAFGDLADSMNSRWLLMLIAHGLLHLNLPTLLNTKVPNMTNTFPKLV
jgi:hypothetical protein